MMQPREIIADAIDDHNALDIADAIIEALGLEGWELVQRGWKAREAVPWWNRGSYCAPQLAGVMPVMMAN